jgi:hypothetical protein
MWDVLAIAPTDDPRAIRRAYAARLKRIDPDRDRDAFACLRQALEWALARAGEPSRSAPARQAPPRRGPVRAPVDEAKPQVVAAIPRPPTPSAAQEQTGERALMTGLESALQRRDAREAWRLYVRVAAIGALPLDDGDYMLARLFTAALEDPAFDRAGFRALAKSFGWDRPDLAGPAVSDVRRRVDGRLEAEDWYDRFLAAAERRLAPPLRHWRAPAQLLLGRIAGPGLHGIDLWMVRALLDELQPRHVWLRDRIPVEWVATLEERYRRYGIIGAVFGVVVVGSLLVLACCMLVGASVDSYGRLVLAVAASLLAWWLWSVARSLVAWCGKEPIYLRMNRSDHVGCACHRADR